MEHSTGKSIKKISTKAALLIFILSIFTVGYICGCGDGANGGGADVSAAAPSASSTSDETVSGFKGNPEICKVLSIDGNNAETVLYEAVYKYYEYDEQGNLVPYKGGSNPIAVLESETDYSDRVVFSSPGGIKPAKAADIEYFTRNKWPQSNSKSSGPREFISFLNTYCEGDLDTFIGLYNQSGMSVEEYASFIRDLYALSNKADLAGIASFLQAMGLTLEEFNSELVSGNTTLKEFFSKAKEHGYDPALMANIYRSKEWASRTVFLSEIADETAGADLFIKNFVTSPDNSWPIYDDNNLQSSVQNKKTILSDRDPDPNFYTDGTKALSNRYRFVVQEIYVSTGKTDVIVYDFQLSGNNRCTYTGSHPVPGYYIRNLGCETPEKVKHDLFWRIDARLDFAYITNGGGVYSDTANPPSPNVIMELCVTYTRTFIFTNRVWLKTLMIQMDGNKGFIE